MLFGDAAMFGVFCYIWLWFADRRCFAIYVIRGDGDRGKDILRCTYGPEHSQKCWCWAEVEVKNTYVHLLWDPH